MLAAQGKDMRRTVLLLALLLLVPAAAGADYFAELATSENTTDLRVDGDWYWSPVEGGTRLTVTYTVTIDRESYSATTLDSFAVTVSNASGVVATAPLETGDIAEDGSLSGIDRVTAPVTATTITRFGFIANHTATLDGGGQADRRVSGFVPVSIDVPPATIGSMATNASTVTRGERLFVNGTAENADALRYDGTTLDVLIDGRFMGWLPVPSGLDPGERTVTYEFVTDRGGLVNGSVTATVENVVPELSVEEPDAVRAGGTLAVAYSASDEVPGLAVNVTFANETVEGSGGRATFDTAGIAPGNYTASAIATDRDGAAVTREVAVEILPATPQEDGADGEGGDDIPAPEEDPLGFAAAFLDFVIGFFTFLIPGI